LAFLARGSGCRHSVSFFVSELSAASLKPWDGIPLLRTLLNFCAGRKPYEWQKHVEIGGKLPMQAYCPLGQESPCSRRQTTVINNYNFNKQGFEVVYLKRLLTLVVVMKIVELWKASQPTDTREFTI